MDFRFAVTNLNPTPTTGSVSLLGQNNPAIKRYNFAPLYEDFDNYQGWFVFQLSTFWNAQISGTTYSTFQKYTGAIPMTAAQVASMMNAYFAFNGVADINFSYDIYPTAPIPYVVFWIESSTVVVSDTLKDLPISQGPIYFYGKGGAYNPRFDCPINITETIQPTTGELLQVESRPNFTYQQFNAITFDKPYTVKSTLMNFSSEQQALETNQFIINHVYGDGSSWIEVVDLWISPDQMNRQQILVNKKYDLNGLSSISIPTLLGNAKVDFLLGLKKRKSLDLNTGRQIQNFKPKNYLLNK